MLRYFTTTFCEVALTPNLPVPFIQLSGEERALWGESTLSYPRTQHRNVTKGSNPSLLIESWTRYSDMPSRQEQTKCHQKYVCHASNTERYLAENSVGGIL